jgi:tetratricopeptide (TPR) repeat protein
MVDRSGVLELLKAGRWREAVDIYEANPGAFGDDLDLAATMGDAYLHSGQYEKAVGSWRIGLRVRPECSEDHYALIMLLLALDWVDEAEEAAHNAVSRFPHDGQLGAQLADILEARNKFEEAAECFQELALHWENPSWMPDPVPREVREIMEDGHRRDAIRCWLKAGDRSSASAIAVARHKGIPHPAQGYDWLQQVVWTDAMRDIQKAEDMAALADEAFQGARGDPVQEAKKWLREIEEVGGGSGAPAESHDEPEPVASQDKVSKSEAGSRHRSPDERWKARLRQKKRRPRACQ